MYIWARLTSYLMRHRLPGAESRTPLDDPLGTSILRFRAWPGDIDFSNHINNGRYATLMDLGRTDLTTRIGLWQPARREGWVPLVGAMALRFRREVRLWQAFTLETRIITWDDRFVVFEHLVRLSGGKRHGSVAVAALVRAGFYDPKRRGFVPPEETIQLIDPDRPAVPRPDVPAAEALLAGDAALEELTDGKVRELVRGRRDGASGGAATPASGASGDMDTAEAP